MWSGAVNRQPGYRARNLQRRGYRAPPPRSKILSGARRYHDRKFSPDFFVFFDTFICIHIKVLKKKKKNKKKMSHDPIYYLTFDLPRKLQSTWDVQKISPQRQRTRGFKPEWKRIVEFLARLKTSPKILPKLRFMFPGVSPRGTITYVKRRGKPPTWLPRQKLAEERTPSATTKIENFLRRAAPPRSKFFSWCFCFFDTFICIHINVIKKY